MTAPLPDETPADEVDTATPPADETPEDGDTFPREYVERLRRENAESRTKAKRADDLAARVFRLEVAATGRLADPADLPYADDLLEDPEALTAAIDALLAAKPHLASRRPRGVVDQGVRTTPEAPASWGSLFG